MQNSFYGGQPGISFIIVIAYESISEMVENFQKGPDYEAVHFDEHVLINTENKNDPDNGKIFRRGYDYTNEMGGAVYVGTIVGPAGRAPMLEMTTIEDVKSKQAQEGYDYRYSEGSYAPFDNLVPGRDGEEYNDEIQWACCSIRNELNNDTTAYIGFIFPYTVIDYEASTVSPYYNRSNDTDDFTNENLVDRVDEGEHPYWEKWHISVPKGIKGDALENFRVITASDDDGVESYDGQADDRANGRQILVYDYYHFDKEEGGEPVTIYLGDYNMITGIIVTEDGTITIEYSHDDDTQYANLFKWITNVTLTDDGHFTIEFNNGDAAYETDLVWVKEVTFEEDGIVTVIYNNGQQATYPNIKWITEIGLTEDGSFHIGFNNGDEYNTNLIWVRDLSIQTDGTVVINYNDGTSTEQTNLIKWINSVELTDDGDFTIEFNNGDDAYTNHLTWVNSITVDNSGTVEIHYNDGVEDTTYIGLIKWITGVSLTQDGTFTVDFNNGDSSYTAYLTWIDYITIDDDGTIHIVDNQGNDISYEQYIKMISDVSINTGDTEGTGNQKVHVKYNTGEEEDIGEPLNYVMRMEMVDSNYHLLVWYSDPAKRQEIIDEGKSYIFDGEDGWLDLGSVKDESGILIGTNYEYDLPDEITQEVLDEIASLLDSIYPNGLQGTDLKGKVVTVGDDNTESKLVYAYDYDSNNWYYIGDLSGGNVKVNNAVLFDQDPMTKEDTLQEGGAWFVIEDLDKLALTIITDLPYQTGDLRYDGTELTPTWANYNPDIMTIGGVTSAINVGTYTTTFTLVDGYIWPNGGNTLDVEWAIIELSYIAFYSTDDSSLNFCSVGTVPSAGNTVLGKTVTMVYEGVENTSISTSSIPWNLDRSNFKSVIFDSSFAGAKPANIAYWFANFVNCTTITGLSYLDTSQVIDMRYTFDGCYSLVSLDLTLLDTSNVTNMSAMFFNCSKLTSLDVSNFNTSAVIDMQSMFYSCSGLTSLDVSNFDTSSVTDMNWMFGDCINLTLLNLTNLDTSQVTDMQYMFFGCENLTTLDSTLLDTSQVTNMNAMFAECSHLVSLNLSNFDTSNVINMSQMFLGCSNLTTIYSDDSKFVTTKVTSDTNMFTNCSKLVGGNGTAYDSSKIDSSMAHVDTADNPGYFTAK